MDYDEELGLPQKIIASSPDNLSVMAEQLSEEEDSDVSVQEIAKGVPKEYDQEFDDIILIECERAVMVYSTEREEGKVVNKQ